MRPPNRGNWQGLNEGWHRAIKTQEPSLTAPNGSSPDGGPPTINHGHPVSLPPNYFSTQTAQLLAPVNTISLPGMSTATVLSFTVPQKYNGWIQSLFMASVNNLAAPTAPTTNITPTLQGQRVWPFLGKPNPLNPQASYTIFPTTSVVYSEAFSLIPAPLQIQDGNTFTVTATNSAAGADTVIIGVIGFMDQNYVPNPSASRSG